MDEIQLIVTGDDAAEAADALEALVAELAPDAHCTRGTRSALPAETQDKMDWGAVIALAPIVLALPPYILACMDIADRIKKRKSADALRQTAERLHRENRVEVHIVTGDGPKRLQDLSADEILDIPEPPDR